MPTSVYSVYYASTFIRIGFAYALKHNQWETELLIFGFFQRFDDQPAVMSQQFLPTESHKQQCSFQHHPFVLSITVTIVYVTAFRHLTCSTCEFLILYRFYLGDQITWICYCKWILGIGNWLWLKLFLNASVSRITCFCRSRNTFYGSIEYCTHSELLFNWHY